MNQQNHRDMQPNEMKARNEREKRKKERKKEQSTINNDSRKTTKRTANHFQHDFHFNSREHNERKNTSIHARSCLCVLPHCLPHSFVAISALLMSLRCMYTMWRKEYTSSSFGLISSTWSISKSASSRRPSKKASYKKIAKRVGLTSIAEKEPLNSSCALSGVCIQKAIPVQERPRRLSALLLAKVA